MSILVGSSKSMITSYRTWELLGRNKQKNIWSVSTASEISREIAYWKGHNQCWAIVQSSSSSSPSSPPPSRPPFIPRPHSLPREPTTDSKPRLLLGIHLGPRNTGFHLRLRLDGGLLIRPVSASHAVERTEEAVPCPPASPSGCSSSDTFSSTLLRRCSLPLFPPASSPVKVVNSPTG